MICSASDMKPPEDYAGAEFYPEWTTDSEALLISKPDRVRLSFPGSAHSLADAYPAQFVFWAVYRYEVNRESLPDRPRMTQMLGPSTTSGVSSFSLMSTACPAISPDAKRLAFCRGGDLWMATFDAPIHVDTYDWDEERILALGTQEGGTGVSNETDFIHRISWSPSGRLLAVSIERYSGSGDWNVYIVEVGETPRVVTSFRGADAVFVNNAAVLFDGDTNDTSGIVLKDLQVGTSRLVVAGGTNPVITVAGSGW